MTLRQSSEVHAYRKKIGESGASSKKLIEIAKSTPSKTELVKAVAPAKNREVSAETRKKMSDAAKKRAAKKAEAAK